MRRHAILGGTAFILFLIGNQSIADEPSTRTNVLFIAIDDLNHWVGHLGRNKQVQTPNIDRLAARGVTFTRAYCAAPLCNPSRAALLSGLRPSTTGVYDNPMDWRKAIPEGLTLQSHLRKHGYYVGGAGKIYHGGFDRRSEWDDYFRGGGGTPQPRGDNAGVGGIKFAPLDCNDDELPDYRIASWIIDRLGEKRDQPFFLACGLHKPHMPWNVPRKYFDMYPLDKIELPPVKEDDLADIPAPGVRMAGRDGGSRGNPAIGPLEGSRASVSGRDHVHRHERRSLARCARQQPAPRQHDRCAVGRSRLASGRETPLA